MQLYSSWVKSGAKINPGWLLGNMMVLMLLVEVSVAILYSLDGLTIILSENVQLLVVPLTRSERL